MKETLREKAGFEVREMRKDYQRGWWSRPERMVEQIAPIVIK